MGVFHLVAAAAENTGAAGSATLAGLATPSDTSAGGGAVGREDSRWRWNSELPLRI